MLLKWLRTYLGISFLSLIIFAVTSSLLLSAGSSNALAEERVEASVIIEVNAAEGNAGVQLFFDSGKDWKWIKVFSPNKNSKGKKIFQAMNFAGVRSLGSTGISTQTQKPTLYDLPLEKLFLKFPEGEYKFVAKSSKGGKQTIALATLTHVIPAAPEIIVPDVGALLPPLDLLVIMWNPVNEDYFGSSDIEIASYQVLIEREMQEPKMIFSVDLPASATSVTVPAEFLEPDAVYKVEVIAIEVGGNKTVSARNFETTE